ncbi:MAG: hypothetical protein GY727_16615, partial [Gammaproteobacteria bacterium]|nr:hypothetical protein [Gammaproteobacteria bacterium]
NKMFSLEPIKSLYRERTKQLTKVIVCSLAVATLLLGMGINPVLAAPIHYTEIQTRQQGMSYGSPTTGTTYAQEQRNQGNGLDQATSSITNNQISLSGEDYNAPWGTVDKSYNMYASVTFTDIMFTDTTNPGASGSTNVYVNWFQQVQEALPSNSSRKNSISLGNTSYAWGQQHGTGTFGTGWFNVNLNTAYTLTLDYYMLTNHSSTANLSAVTMGLSLNPFTLLSGITVNSIDAGIVNNTITS